MSLAARSRPRDRECPQGAPGVQQEEQAMNSMARRMFELVEPIGVIPYSADEPNDAMFALGFTNYWDTYFAGRAAPLGLVPAEVVDALFYNFAPGEVARHIPKVWRTTTPEAAIDGMLDRGVIAGDGWSSEQGRAVKPRVEALTDDLAAKPYESLEPGELEELMATLEPLAARLLAAQDW